MTKKIILILLVIAAIPFVLLKISKNESFQFFGELVTRVETSEKVVALTFDDGPTPNTEKIIQILRDNNIKATFYLTGREIAARPEFARLIMDHGHEIGNHSYTHPRMIFRSLAYVEGEVEKTNQEIRNIGYTEEITFRPPYGRKLFSLPYYLNKNDILSVTWDVEPDSILPLDTPQEELVDYTLEHTKPGSIILMHVMYRSRENSMAAIPGIIQGLTEQGYRFVTVSELLGRDSGAYF